MRNTLKNTLRLVLSKIKWQEMLALVMLLLAFVFFHSERREISSLTSQTAAAKPLWLAAGTLSGALYIGLQAVMYLYSFGAAGQRVGFWDAAEIFLKRNLLSIFLPAGGLTSLAYLPRHLKKHDLPREKVHLGSSIYGFTGILSIFVVGVPLLCYAAVFNPNFTREGWLLALVGVLLLTVYLLYRSFRRKSAVYKLAARYFPKGVTLTESVFAKNVSRKHFMVTLGVSVLIEFCGIAQILLAMKAVGVSVSVTAAALSYIISVVLMLVSPFLRGLGAVEFSLAYVLERFGYQPAEGLGITLLYRLFEFWLSMVAGIVSFFWNGRKLLARLIPAVLIFLLGLINILSAITPPIASRLHMTEGYLAVSVMHYSKILTVVAGILLVITAAYLLKGYKRAWYVAVVLSVVSIAGNLTKAMDYEEALFALLTLLMLVYTRHDYHLRTGKFSFFRGMAAFTMLFIAVILMNFLSFYFIDPRHFGIDFTWMQSLYYTMHTFIFFKDSGLQPQTNFAKDFQALNQCLGILSWMLLIFSFYKASGLQHDTDEGDFEEARNLAARYGNSALDYFKLSDEKSLYFAENGNGFVSYRHDKNFAVVLDMPVCHSDEKLSIVSEFDNHCRKKGLRTAYYRVSEDCRNAMCRLGKKSLLIGQEGIADVQKFTMEGKERKSLRNAVNSLQKKGYQAGVLTAPHGDELLESLHNISDEWLKAFDKKEIVFAEGTFDREMLKNQDIIVLKNADGAIKAFMNLIPDYAPAECTYDMIRRTEDAPNGAMDLLIIQLIHYAKSNNYQYVNLGLAPLSGLENHDSAAAGIMRFAYQKISSFKHYRNLRFFKEKYADHWTNQYLIYSTDADLIQLPVTLSFIMKPKCR